MVKSYEQQCMGDEKVFADLWGLIQNCFFPNAAANNLKPLGWRPVSQCFSYWSTVQGEEGGTVIGRTDEASGMHPAWVTLLLSCVFSDNSETPHTWSVVNVGIHLQISTQT